MMMWLSLSSVVGMFGLFVNMLRLVLVIVLLVSVCMSVVLLISLLCVMLIRNFWGLSVVSILVVISMLL